MQDLNAVLGTTIECSEDGLYDLDVCAAIPVSFRPAAFIFIIINTIFHVSTIQRLYFLSYIKSHYFYQFNSNFQKLNENVSDIYSNWILCRINLESKIGKRKMVYSLPTPKCHFRLKFNMRNPIENQYR